MAPEYLNVRITPGRISKGLLAIPASMRSYFPQTSEAIKIFLDDSDDLIEKPFTPFESSAHEARIYGLSSWFKRHKALGGERIIITPVDRANHIYRFNFERAFLINRDSLERDFLTSKNDLSAEKSFESFSDWTGEDRSALAIGEFGLLSNVNKNTQRMEMLRKAGITRERVPFSMKILIREIYGGHCQVCDFTFLKRNGHPYFEIHHVRAERGHDPKNLLSVCANCHSQFEYAKVHLDFNSQDWLIRVAFNDNIFPVRQALL